MDALTVITLSTLVWKLVAFVKDLTKAQWDPVLTQVVAWVGGIAIVFLTAQAQLAETVEIWGTTLDKLDGASLLILGLSISSFGGAAVEVKKAIDGNDTAAQQTLL